MKKSQEKTYRWSQESFDWVKTFISEVLRILSNEKKVISEIKFVQQPKPGSSSYLSMHSSATSKPTQ